MKKSLLLVVFLLWCAPSFADELTLNDLPSILQKLRGCEQSTSIFSNRVVCKIDTKELWASVDSSGKLTLFYYKTYGDVIYAQGNSVQSLLSDFAATINKDRDNEKAMLDVLAPMLPTQ